MRTVQDAWEMYRAAVLASAKKASQATETGRWNKHISPVLGDKVITALTSLDYLRLRRVLEERRLSPQTVCHCLSLLRRVLKKSAEWGQADKAIPSFKGTMPKFDNRRQRYLTAKELTMLLDVLQTRESSANWHDIALFAVNTGMRKGEIFSLKLSHIDFASGLVTVADTKSGKNRHVPLNDVARRIALKKSVSPPCP